MLLLFYSLAIHMYSSLGGWPTSIGNSGFPKPLEIHGEIAIGFFGLLLLSNMLLWPAMMVVCFLKIKWRCWIPYLTIYAISFVICCLAMSLAPERFLYWWWD